MRISPFILSAGLCAAATLPRRDDSACTTPQQRLEWRALSDDVKKQYIDSVLCLKTKPSELGLSTSRYDDFPYIHTHLDRSIHSVAIFLPWHRLFVHVYESSLRSCGYTGPMPYWDWTLDALNPPSSPIWSPTTGFGGNGDPAVDPWTQSSSKKCLVDGPFKDFEVAYTMSGYEPHCLARNFNNGTAFPGNMFGPNYTEEVVEEIMAVGGYPDFRYRLEGVPHGAVHSAIGGDMSPATSPNDPIFFLHHGQIDRLWTLWQQKDLAVRGTAFGGPKTQGSASLDAKLEDVMPFLGLTADIKVEEVMSTRSALLCYEYV